MKPIFAFCILGLMLTFTPSSSFAAEDNYPVISEDGKYHLQIVMSQWKFDVYNLQANESIEDAIEDNNPIATSGTDVTVGPLLVSTGIIFEIYSQDVQHGFAINELDIAIASNRPSPGSRLGEMVSAETILPSEPMVFTSFCHIFCGLGHPDEKLDFEVVTNLDDHKTSDSDNLRLPFLILPFVLSLLIIVNISKKDISKKL